MNEPVVVLRAQDLGNVVLKFMGLFFLFYGFMSLPGPFDFASHREGSAPGILEGAMHGAVFLVLGVFLTRWSAKLSSKIFAATADIPLPIATELQTVAFRSIGVYVLARSLPFLIQLLVEAADEDFRLGGVEFALPAMGTQVAFGFVLLLYRSAWSLRLWKRLRPLSDRNEP